MMILIILSEIHSYVYKFFIFLSIRLRRNDLLKKKNTYTEKKSEKSRFTVSMEILFLACEYKNRESF